MVTMSKKIGRNDPCPCGSGKKYKSCCLKKDRTAGRVGKRPQRQKKMSAEEAKETFAPSLFAKFRKTPTRTLLRTLEKHGVPFDRELFKEQAQEALSAFNLAAEQYMDTIPNLTFEIESMIAPAIYELWRRECPDLVCDEMIDELFEIGGSARSDDRYDLALELWYEAWDLVERLLRTRSERVEAAGQQWTREFNQGVFNRAAEMDRVLHSLSLDDPKYHRERIAFWERFEEIFPVLPPETHPMLLSGKAEAYWMRGEFDTAEEIFETTIETYPDHVQSYLLPARMYTWGLETLGRKPDNRRAEAILRRGIEHGVDRPRYLYDELNDLA